VAKTLIMEHKTTSEDCGLGSTYWRRLTLDSQIPAYYAGARALGFEPDGILFDVLRKPALRPYDVSAKRSEPESPESYRDRCLADIAERPEYYYQRGLLVRLEKEEADAAADAWQTAEQIRLSRRTERWPRNTDSCSQYNRMCSYWEACSGEASIDDLLLYERGEPHRELEGKHHLPMLTVSSARSYRACPRRYYYSYELGVRSRKEAPALSFGKMVHRALDTWLSSGCDLERAVEALRVDVVYDHATAKAEAMIRGYHERWRDAGLDVLGVEKEFRTDLINPDTGAKSRTFVRAGRIDALVRTAA
jgi:hypothetical protein